MIAEAVVDRIRDLLIEGKISQRKIAHQVGVSRGTVNAIARGKRPDYAPERPLPGVDFTPPGGLPTRCPGCGGMVRMPCLLCHVRAVKRRRRSQRQLSCY